MWQAITDIMTSQNAIPTILICFFIILLGVVLVRNGLLSIKTKYVQFGVVVREDEREIIRRQMEWIKIHLDGLEGTLPKDENYDVYRGKFILEKVFDEYMEWITFNSMSMDSEYVASKQDIIVSLVWSLTDKKEFRTKKFKEFLEEDTKNSIGKLIQIRHIYQK